MRAIVRLFRWVIRRLTTKRSHVSVMEKFVRGALLVPVFGKLLVLLRLRAMMFGALTMDAVTDDGLRFKCRLPDFIHLYLYLFGVWEPDLTHFIRRRLRSGDVFIDVGANIGYYSVIAAFVDMKQGVANAPPTSVPRVVAIEASPAVADDLRDTIALNDLGGAVRIINKAAAAKHGKVAVFAGPSYNTGLTTTVAQRGLPTQTTIDAEPLETLLTTDELHRARLIKIDVEGAEPQVLAGMSRIIAEGGQSTDGLEIVIELSPTWWSDSSLHPIDVLQPFLDAGFKVYSMNNNYWPWRYLWPNCIANPQRWRGDLTKRVSRLDLVLSRVDAEEL